MIQLRQSEAGTPAPNSLPSTLPPVKGEKEGHDKWLTWTLKAVFSPQATISFNRRSRTSSVSMGISEKQPLFYPKEVLWSKMEQKFG